MEALLRPQSSGRQRPTALAQVKTLITKKEAPLKRANKRTLAAEILFPALLCSLLVLGVTQATVQPVQAQAFAPNSTENALLTLAPQHLTPLFLNTKLSDQEIKRLNISIPVPGWIPPLWMYLAYANGLPSNGTLRQFKLPPYDGSIFAVCPDTAEARNLIEPLLNRTHTLLSEAFLLLQREAPPPVIPRYYSTEGELEEAAVEGQRIWAAVVLDKISSNLTIPNQWEYALRFNASALPSTRSKYDRWANGLSTQFERYYSSGFLSLQLAIDEEILHLMAIREERAKELVPSAYGVPFPIPSYSHNAFFDFAGNLIGLVVVFSFLVPISSLLRTIVLERELKLREQLYIMGLRPSAYYGATLIVSGTTYVIIALIAAAEIAPTTYPHSSGSIVVVLFVEFALSTLAFTIALAPLFRNARLAAFVGPCAFFMTSQLYSLFLHRGVLVDDMAAAKGVVSILPTMGFYLAAAFLSLFEGSGHGVSWASIGQGGPFPLSSSLLLLAFSIPLYVFLAWYLDSVVPAAEGTRRPWWFLCFPSSWRLRRRKFPHSHSNASSLCSDSSDVPIEPLAEPMGDQGVAIHQLRKEFGRFVAVNDLTLDIPPGVITALLGPNGAGKSTTISMLTGMIPPTSGAAMIDGKSILTEQSDIRMSIGVCPQTNTLFDDLTPRQHLILYGELRGRVGRTLFEDVESALSGVDLLDRAHTPARALSGGQKRKLCLAIALFGESRTVFLDEPTSGMDPASRRFVWSLLRSSRSERTIVLTTHFLDEAEILADRIAILTEGRLRCAGSPLFLKSYFGVGHTLNVVKVSDDADSTALVKIARDCGVSDASIVEDSSQVAAIRLPGHELKSLQNACKILEEQRDMLGIKDFGIACTTLEDVFLKIIHSRGTESSHSSAQGTCLEVSLQVEASHSTDDNASCPNSIDAASEAQFSEPKHKSELLDSRHKKKTIAAKSMLLSALLAKRRKAARRDLYTTLCSFCWPITLVFLALLMIGLSMQLINPGPRLALTPASAFDQSVTRNRPKIPIWMAENMATDDFMNSFEMDGWKPLSLPSCPSNLSVAELVSDYLYAHQDGPAPAAFAVADGLTNLPFPLSRIFDGALDSILFLLFNSTSPHALPTLLATAHDALLRNRTKNAGRLKVSAEALPYSKWEQSRLSGFIALFGSILIIIPFANVGALFIVPLLREVDSGFKEQQFISGTPVSVYWISSWAWDIIMYLAVVSATLVVIFLVNHLFPAATKAFVGTTSSTAATIVALCLFGFAAAPLASVASFQFKRPSTGLIFLIAFHFLTGFGLLVTDFIMSNIYSTRSVNKSLKWIYRLFPAYSLGDSFFVLASRNAFDELGIEPPPVFSFDQLGAPCLFLTLEGALFGAFTILLQILSAKGGLGKRRMKRSLALLTSTARDVRSSGFMFEEDESIRAEREAIDAGQIEPTDGLIIKHLRKVYPSVGVGRGAKVTHKTAVSDLCLRLQAGECFGLLGTNGAGKSTTFKMLTGVESPTSGDALVGSLSVLENQAQLRPCIGYCPQQDALDPLLTGRETLRLFAAIKGVPFQNTEVEVNGLIDQLDLSRHADKPVTAYSGGNKRKLCVAVAIIGSPSLVLLDEPSSGMDAGSKRFLWSVLRRRLKSSTAILTTHSMEECEALCGRIGVMVDGALRCIGPIQGLKSRFGQGMRVSMRLDPKNPSNPEAVCKFLRERCGHARVDEFQPPNLTLTVPKLPVSSLFGHLVDARNKFLPSEVSLTQCTLEQVFLSMAREKTPDTR